MALPKSLAVISAQKQYIREIMAEMVNVLTTTWNWFVNELPSGIEEQFMTGLRKFYRVQHYFLTGAWQAPLPHTLSMKMIILRIFYHGVLGSK